MVATDQPDMSGRKTLDFSSWIRAFQTVIADTTAEFLLERPPNRTLLLSVESPTIGAGKTTFFDWPALRSSTTRQARWALDTGKADLPFGCRLEDDIRHIRVDER